MPIVQYGERDLLRDRILPPAWYRILIETVGEWLPSKDKQSQNMVFDGTVQFNADTGDTEFAGVPVGGSGTWSFNTKALGYTMGLTKAMAEQCGYRAEDITTKTQLEYKTFEGKVVDVYVENDKTPDGRIKNKVTHKYRAPKL